VNRLQKEHWLRNILVRTPFSIFITIAFLLLILTGIWSTDKGSISRQQHSLQDAISRDLVQCYALEGTYPPSISYLEEHYGLTYNKDLFFVDYQTYGSNLMPSVTIICTRGDM